MRHVSVLLLACSLITLPVCGTQSAEVKVLVSPASPNAAHIDPKLFGNFIELLEDVVPGTWAEMLNDRSFEGVVPAANWCYFDGSPTICDRKWDETGTWKPDIENPLNGKRSAKLSATAAQPATLTQSQLAVSQGMDYHCTGYVRAEGASLKGTVSIKARQPDGHWMVLAAVDLPKFENGWHRFSVDLVSSGSTDRAVFEMRVEGEGSVWADKLSLMPADNQNGWRRDVIGAIKEVRPGVIRWGGSTCDPGEYRWKNGIGDRDLRVPFPNKVWGRIDSNDVGIDEFCQFCELVKAEPLICLSFSDGPESAADLVEYCNGGPETVWGAKRVANGHRDPYRVKYWQVGNEIGGDDQGYLTRMGEFVRLMNAKDPGLALCSSFPGRKLLDQYGKDLAFICPHHYTTDFGYCDRELTDLTHLLDTIPGCNHTQIAITEWNVSGGDWGLMRARQMTLGAALLNARYLNLLIRHADKVKMACRSNLANSFCGAIIETSPSGLLRRPSYHIMHLYASHARPLALSLLQSNDALDLVACVSEDQSQLTIFAVNASSEPVKASLDFSKFPKPVRLTHAEAVCDVEDARQPDVMNHWETPERVTIRRLELANEVIVPALSAVAIEGQTL